MAGKKPEPKQNDNENVDENSVEEALKAMESSEVEGQPDPEEVVETITKTPETEIAQLKDQLIRAMAETENVRKRMQREVEDARKYAMTNFAKDMINVLDNVHRAEASVSEDALKENEVAQSIMAGITMTRKEIESIFDRHGVKRVDPLHHAFNHDFHQAMVEIEDEEHPPGTVVQVMQAGYEMNGRLLRPAMVGVAKAKK